MNPVSSNPLLGVVLHGIGAGFAATCYTPQKQVKRWSWQTYWLTQASFCWFLLPILGAMLTIPQLMDVLREAPQDAMLKSFLLGAAYGIGGTAFGISIRYIGFSLTYSIAVGLSSVLGTLIPPLVNGTLGATLSKPGAGWIITGIVVGTFGIAGTGLAGPAQGTRSRLATAAAGRIHADRRGCCCRCWRVCCRRCTALRWMPGNPLPMSPSAHGAGIWQGNVIYIFSNTGAFITTAIYCLYLHAKHKTLGELIELPAGAEKASLPVNWAMAIVTGLFWYGQFFFYNLGHVHLGEYKFTSWAIHMIMLVLFSNLVGVVLREWRACDA